MKRTTFALVLSLFVCVPAFAQTAPPAAPAREKTIVDLVKDEIAKGDYREAEALARRDMRAIGRTPLAIEAFSWLGRGTLAAKQYDVAMTYASRAYEMVEEQLKTRQLDAEPHLPIALGAAIEVQALALAGQNRRSERLMLLQRESERFKNTSIVMRLNKTLTLLSLEGQTALPWQSPE